MKFRFDSVSLLATLNSMKSQYIEPSGYSQSCSANSLQVENFLIRRAALLRMRSSVAHAQAAHIPARRTAYGASACVRLKIGNRTVVFLFFAV